MEIRETNGTLGGGELLNGAVQRLLDEKFEQRVTEVVDVRLNFFRTLDEKMKTLN